MSDQGERRTNLRLASLACAAVLALCAAETCRAQVEVPATPVAASGSDDAEVLAPFVSVTLPVHERADVSAGWLYVTKYNFSLLTLEAPVRVNKVFTITPGYVYSTTATSGAGGRTHEHRWRLSGTVNLRIKRFTIEDRSMVEHRFREAGDSFRYRNRVQVSAPLPVRKLNLRLFVYDEAFYEGSRNSWDRNLIAAGASRTFSGGVTGQLFYLKQQLRGGADAHALGVAVVVRLPRINLTGI